MTFWNLQGFQGCRYFQLYQPWLLQLSAWYWAVILELPVLAWPFKLTILCCHSKLSFLFLHYFVILFLLLNDKAVILSKWHSYLHENTSLIHSKPNIDRGIEINVYYIYKQCFFNYWKDYLNFVAIRTIIIIWHYFCNGQFEIWEMSKLYNCTFITASVYANYYVFKAQCLEYKRTQINI